MKQLEIFEVKEACGSYVEPMNRLLAQLSSSGINITLSQLQQLVESSAMARRFSWHYIFTF